MAGPVPPKCLDMEEPLDSDEPINLVLAHKGLNMPQKYNTEPNSPELKQVNKEEFNNPEQITEITDEELNSSYVDSKISPHRGSPLDQMHINLGLPLHNFKAQATGGSEKSSTRSQQR